MYCVLFFAVVCIITSLPLGLDLTIYGRLDGQHSVSAWAPVVVRPGFGHVWMGLQGDDPMLSVVCSTSS